MATEYMEPLREEVARLEEAVLARWKGQEAAWLENLRESLLGMERALRRHSIPSEGELLKPVEPVRRERSPRLTREVQALRLNAAGLLTQVRALLACSLGIDWVDEDAAHAEFTTLQHNVQVVLESLNRFQDAESGLVLESALRYRRRRLILWPAPFSGGVFAKEKLMYVRGSVMALSLLLGAAPTVRADDRFYVAMFAAQGEPNLPKLSHTFAVFVKASGEGQFPKDYTLETLSISWLPASLKIMPVRLRPEPGNNFDLPATLKWAEAEGSGVTMWGPFAVKKELYDKAKDRAAVLKSGKMAYIVVDRRFRGNGAVNCIHALSDVIAEPTLDTGTAHGIDASVLVLRHFEPFFEKEQGDNSWLIERLHLKKDKIRMLTKFEGKE